MEVEEVDNTLQDLSSDNTKVDYYPFKIVLSLKTN